MLQIYVKNKGGDEEATSGDINFKEKHQCWSGWEKGRSGEVWWWMCLRYYNSPPETDQIVSHSKISLCLTSTPALGLITNAISAVCRKEQTQQAWLLLSLERPAYVGGPWLATEILFSDGSYHPIWSEWLLYLHCLWEQWGFCWGRQTSVILELCYMPGRGCPFYQTPVIIPGTESLQRFAIDNTHTCCYRLCNIF